MPWFVGGGDFSAKTRTWLLKRFLPKGRLLQGERVPRSCRLRQFLDTGGDLR
jgi:hypothetical protein